MSEQSINFEFNKSKVVEFFDLKPKELFTLPNMKDIYMKINNPGENTVNAVCLGPDNPKGESRTGNVFVFENPKQVIKLKAIGKWEIALANE